MIFYPYQASLNNNSKNMSNAVNMGKIINLKYTMTSCE